MTSTSRSWRRSSRRRSPTSAPRSRRPPAPRSPQACSTASTDRSMRGTTMSELEERSTTPVVSVDAVHAGYVPEVNILNGCNLTVAEGEFVGIIGPNGAGKSTLLKAILGMVPIREGEVSLRGQVVTGMKAHQLVARGVGFVPQTKNVFTTLTVRENLEMGCFIRPSMMARRIDFVVEMFPRLKERIDQRCGSLSGGERQMVAMGRALMLDP